MAQNKINKLELTWIGKDEEPLAIEPRLLIDTPEYSFGEIESARTSERLLKRVASHFLSHPPHFKKH